MARGNVIQKMSTGGDEYYSLAEKYYSILSAVNKLGLTEREIQLTAFAAVRGNMTFGNIREDFCRRHNTTSATINNIISRRLKPMGIMIKENGKVKVNPRIWIDFKNKDVLLNIKISLNEEVKV